MGVRGRRLTLALLLVATLVAPVPAVEAAPVVIDFEDLAHARTGRAYTSVTARYQARGVTFTSGVTAVDYSRPGYAVAGFSTRSGTVGIEECFGTEFCNEPVDMAFSNPQHRVRVWAGYTSTLSTGRTLILEAYSGRTLSAAARAVLQSPKGGGPVPVSVPLEVTSPTNSITRARVRWADPDMYMNGLVLDDVEFEQGVPAFSVTPNPAEFGKVALGSSSTMTVTVTNTGRVQGSVKQVAVTGGDSGDFSIVRGTDTCSSTVVAPGGRCTLDVRFAPAARGVRTSTVVVEGDATGAARLTGEGTTTTVVTPDPGPGPAPDPGLPPADPPPGDTPPPEPTPGAELTLDRDVGPAGTVVVAHGRGFSPGDVVLRWTQGPGSVTATAGPDGTFTTAVVLLAGDELVGPRHLVATGPSRMATARFLLVAGPMQPGGSAASIVHRR